MCSFARALRIIFPEKPVNPALIRITACNQTGCECIVCASNPSLMTGCVFMAHEFHEFSCKRAQPKMSRKGAFYIDQWVECTVFTVLAAQVGRAASPIVAHSPGQRPGGDVALIKVSRSVRAACIMRGNAPLGVKGINGLRAFGAWHFCAGAKMPNVSIAVYVPPGRCPGLCATIGLTARPDHLLGVCANWFI